MIRANGGMFLPDDEQDKVMIGGGSQYQGNKLRVALKRVKNSRTALDIGAHCGLWSIQLGQYFQRVECFEPLERHIECWRRNVGWKSTCHLHEVALGAEKGSCGMTVIGGLSGRSHVNGEGPIPVRVLDDYGFVDVDFLKADVEGYEYFALKGGEKTLLRCKPVMVIEQKPQHGGAARYGLKDRAALDYLETLGAKVVDEIAGDYVLTW